MNVAHRDHDELLIVRIASGDADSVDARLAERQLAACEACRALRADVAAIRASTVAAVLRVPPRPRSFRISPEELERLRAPAWRRLLGRFGAPRFDLVRPFATAVAGIGLAVVVLGSALPAVGPAGLFQAAGEPSAGAQDVARPAETGAPARENDQYGAHTPAAGLDGLKSTSAPTPAAEAPGPGGQEAIGLSGSRAPASVPIVPIGAVLLGSGLALIALSSVARRAAGR